MELMWRMTKPLWGTGKTVIIDSGSLVLKGLIGMYKRRVYGSSVANKIIYWTSGMNGYQINDHVEKKDIGKHDCHSGNLKGVDFGVFFVKVIFNLDVEYVFLWIM